MDRRRGTKRPPPNEESEVWENTVNSYSAFVKHGSSSDIAEAISIVNKIYEKLPSEEAALMNGAEKLRSVEGRLTEGIESIKRYAEDEIKLLDSAIEKLTVLIALRRAPEVMLQDKRKKRRLGSPGASNASSPYATPLVPPHHALPRIPSGLAGPQKPMKPRREHVLTEPKFVAGRKVALRQPPGSPDGAVKSNKKKVDTSITPEPQGIKDTGTYILVTVLRRARRDGEYYVVQDADDTTPEQAVYTVPVHYLLPLPDPLAPPPNPHKQGTEVLAMWPESTTFYKGTVESGPKPPTSHDRKNEDKVYKIMFEDDNGELRDVSMYQVIPHPKR